MKRRALSLLLALTLCLGTLCCAAAGAPAGLSNFRRVNTYAPGTFADVDAGAWYAGNVQTAYELGLVSGTGPNTFAPNDNITLGSVLALACRLHSIYHTGTASFVQGTPWYQVYVDYAVQNGIVASWQYSDYGAPATRRDMAEILARAVPAEALEAKNTVDDGAIPDVPAGAAGYDAIYTLYRAGVLTGSDQIGTFHPDANVDRASVAAMIARVADPALRASVTILRGQVIGLALNPDSLTLDPGVCAVLKPGFTPEDATDKSLTWSSSNAAVATVSYGIVTAVAPGVCTVTAVSSTGIAARCTVTVNMPAPESVKTGIIEAAASGLDALSSGLEYYCSAIESASYGPYGPIASAVSSANSAQAQFQTALECFNTAIELCGNYTDTQTVKEDLTRCRDWLQPIADYGTVTRDNVRDYVLALDTSFDVEGVLDALQNEFVGWTRVVVACAVDTRSAA